MSNNLNLEQMAANQNQKEQTHNDANGQIDAAITEFLELDMSGGDVTLTDAEYRGAVRFVTTGLTADQALTVPAIKRFFMIHNPSTDYYVTVTRGTTTQNITPGCTAVMYTDGTTNGLACVSSEGADVLQVDLNNVNQAIATATVTKVQFDTLRLGVASTYDGVTNYRHTPKKSGIWRYTLSLRMEGMTGSAVAVVYIYKNGVEVARQHQFGSGSTHPQNMFVSKMIEMDGDTDYVEVFVEQDSGVSKNVIGDVEETYLEAEWLRNN